MQNKKKIVTIEFSAPTKHTAKLNTFSTIRTAFYKK